LTIQGYAPGDSTIGVGVQTGATLLQLDNETYALVAGFDGQARVPWPSLDVSAELGAKGLASGSMLRVTVLLTPATATGASPMATWQQASTCVASQ
jgi:hypothetical protein